MSEENTNDIFPATLAEGEAVIPAEKVEEFEALAETILESVVETPEEVVVEEKEETLVDPLANIVASEEPTKKPRSKASVTNVEGAIGSATAAPVAKASAVNDKEIVAIFSEKNARVSGLGSIYRGYNLFAKKLSDKWLTYSFTRLATPEEVARVYNK